MNNISQTNAICISISVSALVKIFIAHRCFVIKSQPVKKITSWLYLCPINLQ